MKNTGDAARHRKGYAKHISSQLQEEDTDEKTGCIMYYGRFRKK